MIACTYYHSVGFTCQTFSLTHTVVFHVAHFKSLLCSQFAKCFQDSYFIGRCATIPVVDNLVGIRSDNSHLFHFLTIERQESVVFQEYYRLVGHLSHSIPCLFGHKGRCGGCICSHGCIRVGRILSVKQSKAEHHAHITPNSHFDILFSNHSLGKRLADFILIAVENLSQLVFHHGSCGFCLSSKCLMGGR